MYNNYNYQAKSTFKSSSYIRGVICPRLVV